MSIFFSLERFMRLLNHLSLKHALDLPKTAKHGTKTLAENEVFNDLAAEDPEWGNLALSTVTTWIGKVEDASLNAARDAEAKKPFAGCCAYLRQLSVKGGDPTTPEQTEIQCSMLRLGKKILEAIEKKNEIHQFCSEIIQFCFSYWVRSSKKSKVKRIRNM
jgi:hypothetical protein